MRTSNSAARIGADESRTMPTVAHRSTAFTIELERAIRLLEGARVRLSLFVIGPTGVPSGAADLSAALADLGMVGAVGGASLGFLYIGPRLHGPHGDGAVERQVARRAWMALRQSGREPSPRAPKIGVIHFWSDSSVGISGLIAEAADLPMALVELAGGSHRGEESGP